MKALLCWLLLGAMAMAAEAPAPWQVRADFQIVQMPQARALALVPRLLAEASAKAAFAEVQDAIARGEVKLVADLSGHGPSGAPWGPIGQLVDFRYPIEYEQEDPRLGPAPEQVTRAKKPLFMGYPSTTFETKPLGSLLEFEASVTAGGKLVEITFSAQTAAFEEWTRYETAVRADGVRLFVEQPVFSTRRSRTSTLLRPGLPQIVGSFQLPGPAPVVELHLLTVGLRNLNGFPGAVASEIVAPEPVELLPGEQPPVTGLWMLSAELHRFQVAPKEALLLRPQLQDATRVDAAFQRLLELNASGQARLVEWQNLPLRSGNRSVCENVREQRYAIEYEMSHPPMNFSPDFLTLLPSVFPSSTALQSGNFDPPTTFETKNLGTTMEVEPVLDMGGEIISLNLAAQAVECPAFMRWNDFVNALGKRSFAYQPQFETRKTATNLDLKNGERALVSFSRLPKALSANGVQYEIVLLRVSARQFQPK